MQPVDYEVEWREFKAAFRGHYIPAGIMDRKLNEFVGAKAKTLPFARGLRQSRCTNGGETTGGFHPSSTTLQDKGLR
jgi:hypothetical protein